MRGTTGRTLRLLLSLALLPLLAACALLEPRSIRPTPESTDLPGGEATLPSHWCGDLVLLDVELDGHGPFRFLLDTGASWCIVSPEVAERVGERSRLGHDVTAAEGEVVTVGHSLQLDELRCGSWAVEELDALVVDLSAASEVLHTRLDGILGWPAFGEVQLVIDGPRREVAVRAGRLQPTDGQRVLHLHGRFLPHVQLETPRGFVRVLVDSGSAGSLSLLEWPGESFTVAPRPWFRSVTLAGLGERRDVARVRQELQLGGYRLVDPVVTRTEGTPRLGSRLLREFRVVLDAAGSRLLLDRSHVVAEARSVVAVEPVVGTGLLAAGIGRRWEVWDVVPDSPAERAGLVVGDVVVALDGRPLDSIDVLCPAARTAELPEEQRITVVRDGRELELVVPLAKLVP